MNITKINQILQEEGYYCIPLYVWNEMTDKIWEQENKIKELTKSRDKWTKKYKELKLKMYDH